MMYFLFKIFFATNVKHCYSVDFILFMLFWRFIYIHVHRELRQLYYCYVYSWSKGSWDLLTSCCIHHRRPGFARLHFLWKYGTWPNGNKLGNLFPLVVPIRIFYFCANAKCNMITRTNNAVFFISYCMNFMLIRNSRWLPLLQDLF